ncbi:MAG: DNRLRE domain-containing protein [Methanobacteriota archaeon]|nr:MAG: DNRLRE domain-containing protein [Euryarchaeota archaeon]
MHNKSRQGHVRCPSSNSGTSPLPLMIIFLMLAPSVLIGFSAGDPVIQDNGDGTMTATWSFQNLANYTYDNVTISPGAVTLKTDASVFVDTTIGDFQQGTDLFNVNVTSSPGNVVLDDTTLAAPPLSLEVYSGEGDGKDSTLYEIMANMNYGAAGMLDAKLSDHVRMLVKFDLSRIGNPQWIESSELWLMMTQSFSAAATNISIHQLNVSWTEGTGTGQPTGDGVTWDTSDGVNPWITPGGDHNPVSEDVVYDIRDQLIWYQWNITELVIDWVNGTRPNHGVILIPISAEDPNERKRFRSKEDAVAVEHPKLVVNYNPAQPQSANGTFVSRVFDAQTTVNWGDIGWNSTIPAETKLSIRTRSGDCLGTWSGWSEAYMSPSGSRITSPPNQCLQYKAEMITYNSTKTPMLEEVVIDHSRRVVDTDMTDFLQGASLFNVDATSDPGNISLNDTSLAASPVIFEVKIDNGTGMDVFLDESFPKKNYGASALLELDVAKITRALVKFDLSSVPNPLQVNHSEIWLQISPGMSGSIQSNISVHQVTSDWIEGTGTGNPSHDGATWESRDAVNPWLNPGGDFIDTPEYVRSNVTNIPDWHKWDITNLTIGWLNGTIPNYGALFNISFGGWVADLKAFYSKDYAGVADRPKLVLFYNSSGPGYANGTFVSRVMNAQSAVNWGNISWDSVVPPQTTLTIHTRTGDCSGSWSGWSQAYNTPSGSQITSPPNRCIQYKAEMLTYSNTTSPVLEEVRINYQKYVLQGSVETEDFTPSNWLSWREFNASSSLPTDTNITYWYSVDSGMFWVEVFSGESLQPLLASTIRFKAELSTIDGSVAPTLYNMSITYQVNVNLDHIHMSLASWTGTTDDSIDLDAIGHDIFEQPVMFTEKWETDDPWGTVNSTGFYSPGQVGTWRVYCNNSTDSVSNFTVVDILPGLTSRIGITPWDPGTVTTDDTLFFNVSGYDSKGNALGPIIANWSVTGGIGSVTPGPTSMAIFNPTTPGFGTVQADDGIGHTNSTNIFQVIAGSRTRVGIEPWSPGTLAVTDSVNFTAFAYDSDGNQIATAIANWTVNGGVGTISPGPSNNSTFTATTPGSGNVSIDDGLGHTNTTNLIRVIAGAVNRVGIVPWSPGTITTDDFVNFSAYAYDIGGNQIGPVSVSWTVNGGIGTIPLGPSTTAMFDATTVSVGNVSIDDGFGHTNTTDQITVIAGSRARIGITPWSPGTLMVNDTVNFTAYSYDLDGNQLGTAIVNWTVNGGIGSIAPGPSDTSTFNATTPGVGTVNIDDGLGHTNSTDLITVVPGSIFRVGIQPWSPGTLTTDDTVNFTAYAYDVGDNQIGTVNVSWVVNGGIGTIPPGPSDTAMFDATTVGTGTVSIDDGLGHTNTTDLITVIFGARARIGITPWSPGTLTADESVNFTAYGYDADDNQIGPAIGTWSVNGGIGTVTPGPADTSVFDATTPGVGTVAINDGLGHTNTTDLITVMAGALDRIDLQPASVILNTSDIQEFTATGYDLDGNVVALINPLWETNAGTIIFSSATNATLQALDTELVGGWIRITATSQNNISANSTLEIRAIQESPQIVQRIPDQVKDEDYGSWALDLSGFALDLQDDLSRLSWFFIGVDESIVEISGDNITGNHMFTFSTVSDAFGNTLASIWLRDSDGNLDSQLIWFNITPVNDRPLIQSIAPFSVHYDVPYSYYFYDYVFDIETPLENLVLDCSHVNETVVNGLWITFTYPKKYLGQTMYPKVNVSDEVGDYASTIIAITVTEDYVPSLEEELPDVTMFEDQILFNFFDLDDYFSDPDGDSLYFTLGNTHVNITIDEVDHTVDFRADTDWNGVEIVTFRAIDPHNARAEDIIVVTVLPENDAPQISGVPDLVVHYDTPAFPDYTYTFDLTPYVSDVDNPIEDLTASTNCPFNIAFYSPYNLVMSIHFPQSMNGQIVEVVISVSDGLSIDTDTIRITVSTDWPPELLDRPDDVWFYEDESLEDAFDIYTSFWDRDGDVLIYSYGNENVVVDINETTGLVSFSSGVQDWFGSEVISFRATDPFGGLSECWITVTVVAVNDAPVITPIPKLTIYEGETWTLDIRPYISDVDNDFSALNISLTGPHIEYVSYAGGTIVFTYALGIENDNILLTVYDGEFSVQTNVEVEIIPKPVPPGHEDVSWLWLIIILVLACIMAIMLPRRFFAKMDIEAAYVIHQSGTLIVSAAKHESVKVDDDIFSGMLTAVKEFVKHYAKEEDHGRLRTLELGERNVLIVGGQNIYLAIVYIGVEKKRTTSLLKDTIIKIEDRYKDDLEDWSGDLSELEGIKEELKLIFGEEEMFSHMDQESFLAKGRSKKQREEKGRPKRYR